MSLYYIICQRAKLWRNILSPRLIKKQQSPRAYGKRVAFQKIALTSAPSGRGPWAGSETASRGPRGPRGGSRWSESPRGRPEKDKAKKDRGSISTCFMGDRKRKRKKEAAHWSRAYVVEGNRRFGGKNPEFGSRGENSPGTRPYLPNFYAPKQ